jgi:hypothetical protein
VTFVRQQALEAFLAGVVDPLAALSVDLIDQRQDFLKATTVPWTE